MKRFFALFLAVVLLLCGCGQATGMPGEPGVEAPQETVAQVPEYTVTNVDEFIAALGSDRVIRMEPGVYDLSEASGYGGRSNNPAYIWREVYDGFELQLLDVRGLFIQGSGKDTTSIVTQPRYANVLALQNCSNVMFQGFTAGHTVAAGECAGGVVLLEGSSYITMHQLGLFGCGVIGVDAMLTAHITISDCDIYDCSNSGVNLSSCRQVELLDCRLTDIGEDLYGGWSTVSAMHCTDVTVRGCQISDSKVNCLLSIGGTDQVRIEDCSFLNNRLRSVAFDCYSSAIVLENCDFQGNNIRVWGVDSGAVNDATLTDGQGNPITEADLNKMYPPESVEEPGERTVVEAATVDEFLAAIAPDTEIVLTGTLYDLSTATDYGGAGSDYYCWEDIFDGPGLVIMNVDNLVIRTDDGDVDKHTIAAIPRYADVLGFSMCTNVTISGFTAGHTQEPGSCAGGVISIRDCDNMRIENCGLFGCGILGVEAEYSGNITVSGCDIYECSYGGIRMWDVAGITIENCTFRDLGGEELSFQGCQDVLVDGEPWTPGW